MALGRGPETLHFPFLIIIMVFVTNALATNNELKQSMYFETSNVVTGSYLPTTADEAKLWHDVISKDHKLDKDNLDEKFKGVIHMIKVCMWPSISYYYERFFKLLYDSCTLSSDVDIYNCMVDTMYQNYTDIPLVYNVLNITLNDINTKCQGLYSFFMYLNNYPWCMSDELYKASQQIHSTILQSRERSKMIYNNQLKLYQQFISKIEDAKRYRKETADLFLAKGNDFNYDDDRCEYYNYMQVTCDMKQGIKKHLQSEIQRESKMQLHSSEQRMKRKSDLICNSPAKRIKLDSTKCANEEQQSLKMEDDSSQTFQ